MAISRGGGLAFWVRREAIIIDCRLARAKCAKKLHARGVLGGKLYDRVGGALLDVAVDHLADKAPQREYIVCLGIGAGEGGEALVPPQGHEEEGTLVAVVGIKVDARLGRKPLDHDRGEGRQGGRRALSAPQGLVRPAAVLEEVHPGEPNGSGSDENQQGAGQQAPERPPVPTVNKDRGSRTQNEERQHEVALIVERPLVQGKIRQEPAHAQQGQPDGG